MLCEGPLRWVAGGKQRSWCFTQRCRNPFDVVDRDVAGLAFDVSNKSSMKTRLECQFLLRPTTFRARPFDILRKDSSGVVAERHGIFLGSWRSRSCSRVDVFESAAYKSQFAM